MFAENQPPFPLSVKIFDISNVVRSFFETLFIRTNKQTKFLIISLTARNSSVLNQSSQSSKIYFVLHNIRMRNVR